MAICDNSVQPNLMQIGRFKLQHLEDTRAVYLIRSGSYFRRCAIHAAKSSIDELLAELVEQVKCTQMRTRRDLDQFREAVSYLALWQGPQETEVQEGVSRRVIGT